MQRSRRRMMAACPAPASSSPTRPLMPSRYATSMARWARRWWWPRASTRSRAQDPRARHHRIRRADRREPAAGPRAARLGRDRITRSRSNIMRRWRRSSLCHAPRQGAGLECGRPRSATGFVLGHSTSTRTAAIARQRGGDGDRRDTSNPSAIRRVPGARRHRPRPPPTARWSLSSRWTPARAVRRHAWRAIALRVGGGPSPSASPPWSGPAPGRD